MEKIKNFLAENYFWIVLVLFFGVFMNTCSQTKTNKRLVRQNNQLIMELDSIKHNFVNKEELKLYIEIGVFNVSEYILNDFNDFARSKASPTDRSRYYQTRRVELEKELKNIQEKK